MSAPIVHSEECQRLTAEYQAKYAAWVETWPDYCRTCHGAGQFSSGGTFWEPPDVEPCEACTEKGICARCLRPGLTSEEAGDGTTGEGPCRFCGWNYDDSCPGEFPEGPCPCEEAAWDNGPDPLEDAAEEQAAYEVQMARIEHEEKEGRP